MRHRRRPSRLALTGALAAIVVLGPAGSALACGGLIAPNGTISLLRTTTLAAYHGGVEHYITSFTFAGSANAELGSIVPLPGIPTTVKAAGEWTLQRLVIETSPPVFEETLALAASASFDSARVLFEVEVDALDITVLEGGAVAVGNWAREHGFFLPPDAPEVLEFYAARSPIFLAARFNAARAAEQGVQEGQGTPIHVVIPTPAPWVPLRILALGRDPADLVQADVYLLTDREPALLPQFQEAGRSPGGIVLERSVAASRSLLADLRSDRGMRWLPSSNMWLSHLQIDTPARRLTHDLAVDASGFGRPNPVAAGLRPPLSMDPASLLPGVLAILAIVAVFASGAFTATRRGPSRVAA